MEKAGAEVAGDDSKEAKKEEEQPKKNETLEQEGAAVGGSAKNESENAGNYTAVTERTETRMIH